MRELSHKRAAELRRRGYRVEVHDDGYGHVQVRHHGLIFNWWPESKKRSVHVQPCGDTFRRVDSVNQFEEVMRGQNRGSDPRKKKSRDQGRRKPGINEAISSERKSGGPLYSGSIPPWDESLGEYRELRPDEA